MQILRTAQKKRDRISRADEGYREIEKLLKKYGVKELFTDDTNFDDSTADGQLMKSIYMIGATYERQKNINRTRDKIREATKAGFFATGLPPTGYVRKEDKSIAKDPNSSSEIEFIFNEFLHNNKKVSEIANSLADTGKRTPLKYVKGNRKVGDRPYNDHAVRNILRNPIYAGFVYRTGEDGERELYEGRHEAYISKEEWESLQTKLQTIADVQAAKADTCNIRHRNAYPLKGIF
ncbi:MAG: recombinase family protein [Opitutales bacterium]